MSAPPEPSWQRDCVRRLLQAVGCLPLPLLHALALPLTALLLVLPNPLRRISRLQLRYCLPQRSGLQRAQLLAGSLLHSAMAVLESPAFWFGPRRRLLRWVAEPAAVAQLQALRAEGKGLILLCPHWGAWELAGLFVSAHAPITALYKPQKGVFDALILEGRSRLGAQLAPTSAQGVKQVVAALRRGEVVGILPDHDPPEGSGVFAPFFGHPAHTMDLVSKLTARSGAPVWFCLAERRPFLGFRIRLLPAPEGIADPQQGVAAMNRGVEAVIGSAPAQYWWGYARYRRRPAGEADPYA